MARVAVEERLLRRKHGAAYDAYGARTPRWLLFHGRPPAEAVEKRWGRIG